MDFPMGRGPATAKERRTILLVDDSDETLLPLARLLQLCGYDVREIWDPTIALQVSEIRRIALAQRITVEFHN